MPAAIGDREPNGQEPDLEPGLVQWGQRGCPTGAQPTGTRTPCHLISASMGPPHAESFFSINCCCVLSCPVSALPRCWDISSGCYPDKIGPAEGLFQVTFEPEEDLFTLCNAFGCAFPSAASVSTTTLNLAVPWMFFSDLSPPAPLLPAGQRCAFCAFAWASRALSGRDDMPTHATGTPLPSRMQPDCWDGSFLTAICGLAANQGASRVWQTATDALPHCWEQHHLLGQPSPRSPSSGGFGILEAHFCGIRSRSE